VHGVSYTSVLSPALVGRRIMVRYAGDDGRLTDAVGDLVSWRDGQLTVRTRSGDVTVPESAIVAGKPVPEPRLRRAADISVAQLHRVAARGWRPRRTEWVGGWLLRASDGFTRRANSVLSLGDPGRPMDDALATVAAWYAEQRLPARFQVPLGVAEDLDAALAARGWSAHTGADVLVADVADVIDAARRAATARSDHPPRIDAEPSTAWLRAYHYGGRSLPAGAEGVLTRHDRAAFVSVASGPAGDPVAIARAAVDGDWVGLTAVEVAPAERHRGLGRLVSSAAVAWGAELGARHAYLQVAPDNAAASRLYAGLGFVRHSRYHYRTAPAVGG